MTAYKSHFKNLLLLSTILSSSLSYSADAVNYHYIFGGGGDPKGPTTIFDKYLSRAADFTKDNKDWKTTISFNGGHSETEKILADKFKSATNVGAFTEKTYQEQIAALIKKIENGEIKKGEQLLININTHGAKKSRREKTHGIAFSGGAATELQNLSGASVDSLDNLEGLADIAALKGVKLAIIDSSCFSGNTLNITNKNTCIISASGPTEYSYSDPNKDFIIKTNATFTGKLISSFEKGKNLEELYLAARANNAVPDFPMISTPEGRELHSFIHNAISPFLIYNVDATNISDFSAGYNSRTPDLFEKNVCDSEKKYLQMQESLKKIKDILPLSYVLIKKEFSSLVEALEKYRDFQLEYEKSIRSVFKTEKEVEVLLNKYDPAKIAHMKQYKAIEIVGMNYDEALTKYKKMAGSSEGFAKLFWDQRVKELGEMKVVAEEIKNNLSDESKSLLKNYNKINLKLDETWKLAANVSRESKNLYDSLYRQMMKPETNPCRDFVL